ncbi:caspase family protein [Rhizorhabdus sp. FW153]|uniref:caspase family protein n=1 Tax=Rhizorhabdus sp. FW153 TaxID=3400216 RepID=UPI003CFA9271
MIRIAPLLALVAVPLAIGLSAGRAEARIRAVLVGASEFEETSLQRFALPGAAHDAHRMADALTGYDLDAGDLRLLTGRAATADAIRAALDDLARQSTSGDRAILFLSGHGAQAPTSADDGLEPDGLDEWFLAADAGPWDPASKTLAGAIKDDEIGRRVRAMRAAGVDIWVLIDSCAGGGLLRGSQATAKSIAGALLGIAQVAPSRGAADASGFVDAGLAGGGRLVVFAAAGPGQVAWDDGDGGRFTKALAAALQTRPDSFAALAAKGGAAAIPWTTGELSAPVLFDGRSPDLIEIALGLPPLPFATRLSIDDRGACAKKGRVTGPLRIDAGRTVTLDHCDHVRVDFGEPGVPLRLEAWYRDAGGGYSGLAPPAGLALLPGRWANVGFTFVTRDPVSQRPLPMGEEQLILIARDEAGIATAATILHFRGK